MTSDERLARAIAKARYGTDACWANMMPAAKAARADILAVGSVSDLAIQEELEPAFQALHRRASAERSERKVADALLALALANVLAVDADETTESAIARAVQSVHSGT